VGTRLGRLAKIVHAFRGTTKTVAAIAVRMSMPVRPTMGRISMKHARRKLLAGGLGALALMGFLGATAIGNAAQADDAWARTQAKGVLEVCGVDGLLPYSSSDTNTPGFEVEIARAMAAKLGVKAEYNWVTWDALIPALTSNRCDAIINGLFITDERKKVIDFSVPYYGSGETILVLKSDDSVHKVEDLKDKKVGALAGSVTVQFLEKAGIKDVVVYPDQNTIIIELNNKRIDATYLEAPSAAWAIQKDPTLNIKVVHDYIPEERWNAGVGVRKEDTALKAEFDRIIPELIADGTIAKILDKYGIPYFPPKS
jgi:polar amino acid transport system substrate-binding protein